MQLSYRSRVIIQFTVILCLGVFTVVSFSQVMSLGLSDYRSIDSFDDFGATLLGKWTFAVVLFVLGGLIVLFPCPEPGGI